MTIPDNRFLIAYESVIPATLTLSSGTLASGSALTNLNSPFVSGYNILKFTSTSIRVKAQYSANLTWDYVSLIACGGDTDATIQWRIDDSISAAPPFNWDSGSVSAFDFTVSELSGGSISWPSTGRHVIAFPPNSTVGDELDFLYTPGTSPSSKTIGALRVGRFFQFDIGAQLSISRSMGYPRTLRVPIIEPVSNIHKIESLIRSYRTGTRLLVIPRPLDPETWISEALYCKLSSVVQPEHRWVDGTTHIAMELEFEEVGT